MMPVRPTHTAAQRWRPTDSRSTSVDSAVISTGAMKKIDVGLGDGHGGQGEEKGAVGDDQQGGTGQMQADAAGAPQPKTTFETHSDQRDRHRAGRAHQDDLMQADSPRSAT